MSAELVSDTCVRGKALNPHTLKEMALVHVKGAFRHEHAVLSARDKVDIKFAAHNQVTYLSIPFVRTAADVLEVGCLDLCQDRLLSGLQTSAPLSVSLNSLDQVHGACGCRYVCSAHNASRLLHGNHTFPCFRLLLLLVLVLPGSSTA